MGHTKNYTKVVIKQIEEERNAKDLIGKVVKVMVTSAIKWHVVGEVIDYAPKMPEVDPLYFEKLEKRRE